MKKKSRTYWQDKLNAWYKKEQKKGLIDMKPFIMPRSDGQISTIEEVCEELYKVLTLPRSKWKPFTGRL